MSPSLDLDTLTLSRGGHQAGGGDAAVQRVEQGIENSEIAFARHTEALRRTESNQAFHQKLAAVTHHLFDLT